MSSRNLSCVAFMLFIICAFIADCLSYQHPYHHNGHYSNLYRNRHSHSRRDNNHRVLNHHRTYTSKRDKTDLDDLIEKLNLTKDYRDSENNVRSSMNDSLAESLPITTTTDSSNPHFHSGRSDLKENQNLLDHINPSSSEDDYDDDDDVNYDDKNDEDARQRPMLRLQVPSSPNLPNNNTQSDSQNGYRSSFSNHKWKMLTDKTKLEQYFETYSNGAHYRQTQSASVNKEVEEALKHSIRISKEWPCRIPRPKIIRVADHYPDTNKQYQPSCTTLFQCSEDTGCCVGRQKRCQPKRTEPVFLYFYVTSYVYKGANVKADTTVEKLKFYNHTECECTDVKDELMPRDSVLQRNMELQQPINQPEERCNCPSEYTVRYLANGSCSCDCFDKQRDCIKYKKGKEYFNHQDRLCIEMGTCLQPTCDFGVYNRRSGRCPRKHEKFRPWSRFRSA